MHSIQEVLFKKSIVCFQKIIARLPKKKDWITKSVRRWLELTYCKINRFYEKKSRRSYTMLKVSQTHKEDVLKAVFCDVGSQQAQRVMLC